MPYRSKRKRQQRTNESNDHWPRPAEWPGHSSPSAILFYVLASGFGLSLLGAIVGTALGQNVLVDRYLTPAWFFFFGTTGLAALFLHWKYRGYMTERDKSPLWGPAKVKLSPSISRWHRPMQYYLILAMVVVACISLAVFGIWLFWQRMPSI